MAKKRAAGGFNMAAEIRNLLQENRALTGGEIVAALKEKFPKESINENSAAVAFFNARRKLGIKVRGKRRRSRTTTVVKKPVPRVASTMDLAALQTAAKFVSEMGGADKALEAVRQVKSLQIK
jgi:hypothetical protein